MLTAAAYRAAAGKRRRPEVAAYMRNLFGESARLRTDILDGSVEVGKMKQFAIRDPKPRIIHAPCFRERVLHHALMHFVGPALDRTLVHDSYACRVGKGTLEAVRRVQHHLRRFAWYGKLDVRAYFASIDHEILLGMLRRRFRDAGLLWLITRIVHAHETAPGKGLPIGALTSQHFANLYLGGLDRHLLEHVGVRGLVRYMDDIAFWCDTRDRTRAAVRAAVGCAADCLDLDIKPQMQINRSVHGITYCGFRVTRGAVRLTPRRRRRYSEQRRQWEEAFAAGRLSVRGLQAGYASALAVTAHAEATGWRREQLRRCPPLECCRDL